MEILALGTRIDQRLCNHKYAKSDHPGGRQSHIQGSTEALRSEESHGPVRFIALQSWPHDRCAYM